MKKETSIQRIHRERRKRNFVGRVREIESFRENLNLSFEERKYVWNIYGQGGIGKTSLLKRLLSLSQEQGSIVAFVDETQSHLLQVMGSLAGQFKKQGQPLTRFAERYHKYRELKQQIEGDPKLPSGVSSIIGRAVVRAGIGLVRQIPGAGIAMGLLGEENLVQKAGELTTYLAQRLGNKDEVRLLLEPIELLTPLFLQDLSEIAADKQVVIGFDTFEKTGGVLDEWLRRILEGDYGELHAGVLLIIAGRDKLDSAWTDYMGIVHIISLGILPETDARHLLTTRGVSDSKTVDLILKLSGRIPLWLASLASQVPFDGGKLSDPTDQAVDCFLKWIQDEDQRRAVLLCALPERLDHDVVSVLLESEKVDVLFDWLKTQPFIQKKAHEGWTYHEVVRTMMLRHLRNESRTRWDNLNEALGDFFASRRDGMALSISDAFNNDDWVALDLCSLFHKLCFQPKTAIGVLVEKVVSAIPRELEYTRRLGETAKGAGLVLEDLTVKRWGEQIVRAVDASLSNSDNAEHLWQTLLDRMEKVLPKDSKKFLELILERIRLYEIDGQHEAALAEACRAISQNANDPQLFLTRASIFERMKKNDDALADYAHAATLTPNIGKGLVERARLLARLGRMDEALDDVTTAITREPQNVDFLEERARILEKSGLKSEALEDRSRAIELRPQSDWPWIRRAGMFKRMGELEKALQDYTQALQILPEDFIAGWRADLLVEMGRYDEALTGYAHAIELRDKKNAESPPCIFKIGDKVTFVGPRDFEGRSGNVLVDMGKYEEALVQFSRAIDRGDIEERAFYLNARARLLEKLERLDEARDDRAQALPLYNTLIDLCKGRSDLLIQRGNLLKAIGRKKEALRDYSRITETEADKSIGWLLRSNLLSEMGEFEDALSDFKRAYELEPNRNAVWDKHMARLLGYLRRYEEALIVCIRASDVYPEDWELACQVAVMLTRTKGYDAARETILKAKKECKAALETEYDTSARYALARLAAIEKNFKGAIGYLEEALSSCPDLADSASHDVAFLDLQSDPAFLALMTGANCK